MGPYQVWGRYLAGGAIPKTDPYNYTFPNHVWFNHEWLTEVIFYLLYKVFGSTGILIWKMPESKVSIDGRYWTVYPPDSIIQNAIFHFGWKGWEYYLDLYPHEIILTIMKNQDIESHEGWVKIYQDFNARIFVRKTDPPHPAHLKFIDHTLVINDSPPSETFP